MTRGRRKQQAAAPFAVPVLLLALVVSTSVPTVRALTSSELSGILFIYDNGQGLKPSGGNLVDYA